MLTSAVGDMKADSLIRQVAPEQKAEPSPTLAVLRCLDPGVIAEMLATDKAVIADIHVDKTENCFPMIPSGAAHTDMLLYGDEVGGTMDDEAKALV